MRLEYVGRDTVNHTLDGVPKHLGHHCECGGDQKNREGQLVMEPGGGNRCFKFDICILMKITFVHFNSILFMIKLAPLK